MSNNTNKFPNKSISFDIPVNEKTRDFFVRMIEEQKQQEEAVKERMAQLFDEYFKFETNDEKSIACVKQVFALGYQLGWNDNCNLCHKEQDMQKGEQQ